MMHRPVWPAMVWGVIIAIAGPALSASEPSGPAAPAAEPPPRLEGTRAASGSIFGPAAFRSLGKLAAGANATVAFDTDSLEVSGAAKGKGALGVSQGGRVQAAVFAFEEIALAAGSKVAVTGRRPLVLVSKGPILIDTAIDLSGRPGDPNVDSQGPGVPGGPGGYNGGPATKDTGRPGDGPGAGFCKRVKGGAAGGGGAFGGAGGDSSPADGRDTPRMPGGKPYGDAALTDLFGGSGGAGGSHDRMKNNPGGGGAGGGALELVSLASITIGPRGRLVAAGGRGADRPCSGGGGAGGAILLAAPSVRLEPGAILDVRGGDAGKGGPNSRSGPGESQRTNEGNGGGGGGGRIAICSADDFGVRGEGREEKPFPKNPSILLDGGKAGGKGAADGRPGTFYDGRWLLIR